MAPEISPKVVTETLKLFPFKMARSLGAGEYIISMVENHYGHPEMDVPLTRETSRPALSALKWFMEKFFVSDNVAMKDLEYIESWLKHNRFTSVSNPNDIIEMYKEDGLEKRHPYTTFTFVGENVFEKYSHHSLMLKSLEKQMIQLGGLKDVISVRDEMDKER